MNNQNDAIKRPINFINACNVLMPKLSPECQQHAFKAVWRHDNAVYDAMAAEVTRDLEANTAKILKLNEGF